jgi:hypothetical protein
MLGAVGRVPSMLNDLLEWAEGTYWAALRWVEGTYHHVAFNLTYLGFMDWSATTWLVLLGAVLVVYWTVYSLWREQLQHRQDREAEATRRNRNYRSKRD